MNKNKKFEPLNVNKDNEAVGTFKCDYVYTDIKTYLSGELVESYAIDGRTLINVELCMAGYHGTIKRESCDW